MGIAISNVNHTMGGVFLGICNLIGSIKSLQKPITHILVSANITRGC